jgi:hypothetical protein
MEAWDKKFSEHYSIESVNKLCIKWVIQWWKEENYAVRLFKMVLKGSERMFHKMLYLRNKRANLQLNSNPYYFKFKANFYEFMLRSFCITEWKYGSDRKEMM